MIRYTCITQTKLDAWLVNHPIPPVHATYRVRHARSAPSALPNVVGELKQYANDALADAKFRLRRGFVDPLSPFKTPSPDPAAFYPTHLHQVTLMGYLGETLAGVAVEHWGYGVDSSVKLSQIPIEY